MIHISPSTNHYLTNIIGDYVTELRGEIIIKGKGVMETFWLLGHGSDVITSTTSAAAPVAAADAVPQRMIEPPTFTRRPLPQQQAAIIEEKEDGMDDTVLETLVGGDESEGSGP